MQRRGEGTHQTCHFVAASLVPKILRFEAAPPRWGCRGLRRFDPNRNHNPIGCRFNIRRQIHLHLEILDSKIQDSWRAWRIKDIIFGGLCLSLPQNGSYLDDLVVHRITLRIHLPLLWKHKKPSKMTPPAYRLKKTGWLFNTTWHIWRILRVLLYKGTNWGIPLRTC